MKFLVLSDIHGNNIALDAILNTVPISRYDSILVLGDNIGDGPCPDKVISTLKSLDAVMIQGNREELALKHFNGFKETQTAKQWEFMRDSFSFLTDEQKAYIASLPEQKVIDADGISLRMVHGSPSSNREILCSQRPDQLIQHLDAIDEPIILCGHNHCQFSFMSENRLVLNPGSVGLSQKGEPFRADYALLTLSAGQFSFELNHVYYNGEQIKKEYIDRNLWDKNIWGRVAYKEMSEGKTYIIAFARFVFNLAKEKGACTHPLDDKIWLEACEKWDWTA